MSDSESDSELQQLIQNPGVYQEIQHARPYINNKPLLVSTLERISNRLPWIERLEVTTEPALPPKDTGLVNDLDQIDPNDDFKREALFYRLAQAAVLVAIPKLHELDIPTKRPNDYFAEMIKSDAHMVKVREHIVVNKKRLELRERARQLREQRKFGKQQQKEILEARRLEKKKHANLLKVAMKKPGGKERTEMLQEFLQNGPAKTPKNKAKKQGFGDNEGKNYYTPKEFAKRRKINHKREFKNQTYGHGGQKKRSKRNDSSSIRSTRRGEAVSVLSHKASAGRVNQLQNRMRKSKRKNTQQQKKKFSKK